MRRPYRDSAADVPAQEPPILADVDLSGRWRADVADDERRRSAVGLEYQLDDDWPEVDVPGHWRTASPFSDNDAALIYRKRFNLEPPSPGRRHFVTFDGVFYQADVWLDGAYLGDPEGYFFPHSFDITSLSRLATEHVLAVEVACPPQRNRKTKRTITGVFQNWDAMDPTWNPGGIWRPVRIETTGPVRIDRLRVLCRDVNDTRAHLRLHARLDSDTARTAQIRTSVDGVLLDQHEQSLAGGLNEVDWNLDVNDPRLWWPWTLGDQELTNIDVEISVDGELSHDRCVRTGLREVVLQDWVFTVNGEPMFVKGANLAPSRMALGDATAAELRRDVELAREAGLDLLRVHGHISRPELYDAADELGMLLWQDFPLQWGYARTIRKEAVRQAREAVDELGHHPSIAVWCAHNEPVASNLDRTAGIGKAAAKYLVGQQLPSWNKTVLDRWVKRAFEQADETRTTIAHSGMMPHLPLLDGTDSHLYFGWYHGHERDLPGFAASMPRMVRFVSEFGAQAVPASADFMEPETWPDLDWETLQERHGMQLHAFDKFVPPDDYETFDAWRDATQQYQATVLRHHIETMRRLKYHPTGGFCFFMLNDAGPMVSWSVLDHERRPKLAYQAVVDACRPVIVVADRLPETVSVGAALALDVHVVSDIRRLLEGMTCTATLSWPGGSHAWRWGGDVPPDACVRVGTIQFVVADAPGELWLDLVVEHGDEVASNRYVSTIVR
jgi:beta-mannosidase